MAINTELLTPKQVEYWKDPEKKRQEQRAKYVRYPKRIYEINRAWQQKNKDYYNALMNFAQKIRKARLARDEMAVNLLVQEKEEYKKAWRAKNRPAMDEETRWAYCEIRRVRERYNSRIWYYKNKKHDLKKANELARKRDAEIEALEKKIVKTV